MKHLVFFLYGLDLVSGQVTNCGTASTNLNCVCASGQFRLVTGYNLLSCALCRRGSASSLFQTQANVCPACVPGKIQPNEGQGSCIDCEKGKYEDLTGEQSCNVCGSRSYQDKTGQISCIFCSTGSYQDLLGQSSCKSCEIGTYASESAMFSCYLCDTGKYTSRTGHDECISCLAGSYQDSTGASNCKPCSPGSYQDLDGASNCNPCTSPAAIWGNWVKPCVANQDAQNEGCTTCNKGKQLSSLCSADNLLTSAPTCVDCPKGKMQPSDDQENSECTSCDKGKYQDSTGKESCKDCTMRDNARLADPYSFNGQSNNCPMVCNAGYFPNPTCVKCPPGQYRSNLTATTCSSCSKPLLNSVFQNSTGSTSVTSCPWGCNIGFEKSGTACSACAGGKYRSNLLASTTCSSCTACTTASIFTVVNCSSTRNSVCASCATTCGVGRFKSSPCTQFRNTSCQSCSNRCNASQYISTRCPGTGTVDNQRCSACTLPSQCPANSFLNTSCTGLELQNLECRPCTVRACGVREYERVCERTRDSACFPLTVCPNNQYLQGFNRTSNGVCRPCTTCSNGTLIPCTSLQDTACNLSPCSLAQPCRSVRSFCLFYISNLGVCGLCPEGFSGDGLNCHPCPRLKTCNSLGEVVCEGELSYPSIPVCIQGYTLSAGLTATARIAGYDYYRGLPVDGSGIYFKCPIGMYIVLTLQGNQTCSPCTNPVGVGKAYETRGLTTNDPGSCLVACSERFIVNSEVCISRNLLSTDTFRNPEFSYRVSSSKTRACPTHTMSAMGKAFSTNDCEGCPAVVNSNGDRCKNWACDANFQKRADLCYQQGTISQTFMIPWQRPGSSKTGLLGQWILFAYNLSQNAPERTFGVQRFPLPGTNRSVEGRVCSSVVMHFFQPNINLNYSIFTFCGVPAVYYMSLKVQDAVSERVIGTTTGYQEGFKNQAKFGDEIFVTGFERRLYIADRLNCAIRVVNMLAILPGAYSARSYLLFGSPPLCEGVNTVNRPYNIFLISSHILFSSLSGVYGFDLATRTLGQVTPSELYNILNITGDAFRITLWEKNRYLTITAKEQHCPNGTTSRAGTDCVITCQNQWVDQDGACRPCTNMVCEPGEGFSPCTSNQDSSCYTCPILPPERVYTVRGDCRFSVFVPPCPLDWYTDGNVCAQCPMYSSTYEAGATLRAQCKCMKGTVRDLIRDICVITNPYPVLSPTKCPFAYYDRGVDSMCSSCRVRPYRECPVGLFTTKEDTCMPCLYVANSRFHTQGLVINSPTSCAWECMEGFYQNTSQSQCSSCTYPGDVNSTILLRPTSNGGVSPEGCRWTCDYPYRMQILACVPCRGYNPLHVNLSCVGPGQKIQAPTAEVVNYTIGDVSYTAYILKSTVEIRFMQNVTVDILLVGGGGMGGENDQGPGGGGAGGQVVLHYNVLVLPGLQLITVGRGQTTDFPCTMSQVFNFVASTGGKGGTGTKAETATGKVVHNEGGSGARGNSINTPLVNWPSALNGNLGGIDLEGRSGGGGGGSAGPGGNSTGNTTHCRGGDGGLGTTVNFVGRSVMYGAGGVGGSVLPCTAGTGHPGAGRNNNQNAGPNTGAGGAGGLDGLGVISNGLGGVGGSGIVVIRFVDEPCLCI